MKLLSLYCGREDRGRKCAMLENGDRNLAPKQRPGPFAPPVKRYRGEVLMSKVSTLLTRFWVVGLFTLPAVAQVQTDKNACLKKYQKLIS